ncbi:MAG TPA: hypothetical protein DCX07_01665 [Phycisphaerales bacterium]|nr:hypothetical protein [Phycisphaerales bacterium]
MTTNILEQAAIEDTLFGQSQVTEIDASDSPDTICFCICSCMESSVKITDSKIISAGLAVSRPQP